MQRFHTLLSAHKTPGVEYGQGREYVRTKRSSYPKLYLYEKGESALRQKCVYVNSGYICGCVLQHPDAWGSAITNKMSSLPVTYQTLVVSNITIGFAHNSTAKWQQGFYSIACFPFSLWNNCLPSYWILYTDKYVCYMHTESPQGFSQ